MAEKEAKARIKINKLLEESGWSFFDTDKGKATIKLESSIKMDDLGEDFENAKSGFIDFLLVDENQNPILVLEAKKESLNPLVGKEQARNYAKSQKVKFIILSNGTLHYLWNIETGNPEQIQVFPTLESIKQYYQFNPEPSKLVSEQVNDDYVVLTQLPNYKQIPEFQDEQKKKDLIFNLKLRFLRYYQVEAIKAVQQSVSEGKKRFLLEMATGTGMSFDAALDTLNTLWPIVEYAHPNYIAELNVLPNDARFVAGDQAGLHPTTTLLNCNININPAWDLTVGRDNCRIGIYDTGLNWDHEDFSQDNSGNWNQSRVKGGWDWVFGVHPSTKANADDNGHGSNCGGIVGAIRNNDRGVAGVAGGNGAINQWGVDLYSMKLFDANGSYGKASDLADAVTEGATSFNGTYGYSLNVMNCSWFLKNPDINVLIDAVRYAYRNNVVMSFASGNTSSSTAQYPSSYRDEWVMKVGANDQTGSKASFSTTGNNLDFIAPGTFPIYASVDANTNNTYAVNDDGTSFAAPHASGVAGLMMSYINSPSNAPNNLAPEDVENLIQRFATDVGASGYDNDNGFGRINAGTTLQGIRWPRFEVRHYTQTFNNNSGTKIGSNVQIQVAQGANGVAAGTYFGDVYEITQTYNITQPTGRTIIDVWKRNSSSTLWGNQPVVSEVNSNVTSWSQTSATMKGYIFEIKTNILSQAINKWLPSGGLNGTGRMSLTVYSEDPLATGVKDIPIDKNFARVVPNPSNGNFTILFTLLKSTELGIEVTDLTGKVVYSQPMKRTMDGHQEIELQLQNLNAGMYICNLRTSEGMVSQKISIVK